MYWERCVVEHSRPVELDADGQASSGVSMHEIRDISEGEEATS